MSQSEEPPEMDQAPAKEETEDDDTSDFKIITTIKNLVYKEESGPATPMAPKKQKKPFQLKIPKLGRLDLDTAQSIVSAYNCLFRVQHSAEESLVQCLRMYRELETMTMPLPPACIYETINVILERKIELPFKMFSLEVENALSMFEKRPHDESVDGVARFYLNKVIYWDHRDSEVDDKIVPSISAMKLDAAGDANPEFKTPAPKQSRIRALKEEGTKGTPVKAPKKSRPVINTPSKVPKSHQLPKPKKIAVFNDQNQLPKPTIQLKEDPTKRKRRVAKQDTEWTPSRSEMNPKVSFFLF